MGGVRRGGVARRPGAASYGYRRSGEGSCDGSERGRAREAGGERRRRCAGGWVRVRVMSAGGVVLWNARLGKRGGSASPIVEG